MMELINGNANITWYILPLSAAISLVYCASRFEQRGLILRRSLRLFLQIVSFMLVVFGLLYLLSFRL